MSVYSESQSLPPDRTYVVLTAPTGFEPQVLSLPLEIGTDDQSELEMVVKLGLALAQRFEQLGVVSDIEGAIRCFTRAFALSLNDSAMQIMILSNLGTAYHCRFEGLGDLADLEKAIEYQTSVIELTPDEDPSRAGRLANLGNSWVRRFERRGDLADLNKAVKYHTTAVELTADDHPIKSMCLNSLGSSWYSRFSSTNDLADIAKAIDCQTWAIQLVPDDHPAQPGYLVNLGMSWNSRFQRLGDLADLEKAIACHTRAIELTPEGHSRKAVCFTKLGESWLSRFQQLGELADIDKAIACQTRAVELAPDGHPYKAMYLNTLGASWFRRYGRLHELADINKSIECQTRAIELTSYGDTDQPGHLTNLGNSLQCRFEQLGDLADIDKAINCQTQAADLIPDDHPDQAGCLANLGCSLNFRFGRLGDATDINKAVDCLTRAVELTAYNHPNQPFCLFNLANALLSRFQRLGNLTDLDKAIGYQTKAVELSPDSHPNQPLNHNLLGSLWFNRFGHSKLPQDLRSACVNFRTGALWPMTKPLHQLHCSRRWVMCSLMLGDSPLQAFETAFTLIPHLVWQGLSIEHRYELINMLGDLASEAAAWAISVHKYDTALEWLEEGRSVIWSQTIQLRAPFDDIAAVRPELAHELRETASQLDTASSLATTLDSRTDPQPDPELQAQRHHSLAAKWDQLLQEARKLPSFHDYMLPRKAQELKGAAIDGPVVVINSHPSRCDALVIKPERGDIIHVPLSRISHQRLLELRMQTAHGLSRLGDHNRARGVKNDKQTHSSQNEFHLLTVLWNGIVEPILDSITDMGDSLEHKLPHVTWCASGVLSFLPIHAAGLYDGTSRNAFDLIVSSYTPTLSALLLVSRCAAASCAGVLAVGQSSTPNQPQLPHTVDELAIVQHYTTTTHHLQLDDSRATVNATLTAMEQHSWVHMACHAIQNPMNPRHSAFYLHDGQLTLEEIAKRSFKNKGLAFLSACQTATGDNKLPDEATHLAAGMLMAGYPSVIATMWSVADEDGPEIAEVVYAELTKGGKIDHTNAARALYKAVGKLREKVGARSIKRWAPFVHIGV